MSASTKAAAGNNCYCGCVKPQLPLIILTLGSFGLVVNGLMLWLPSAVSDSLGLGFHVSGFWAALFGSLVVSIVSTVLWIFITRESMC